MGVPRKREVIFNKSFSFDLIRGYVSLRLGASVRIPSQIAEAIQSKIFIASDRPRERVDISFLDCTRCLFFKVPSFWIKISG